MRHIENDGIPVAIIIDNTLENVNNIIMSDDGTGNGITIPSMLISKKDGLRLIDFIQTATNEELYSVAIEASFDMKHPDDRVEYDIWYTSSNDRALDFIREFSKIDKKLGTDVKMTPHFIFWKCPFCDDTYLNIDCYAQGKYCAIEPSNENINGRDIIQEDLR